MVAVFCTADPCERQARSLAESSPSRQLFHPRPRSRSHRPGLVCIAWHDDGREREKNTSPERSWRKRERDSRQFNPIRSFGARLCRLFLFGISRHTNARQFHCFSFPRQLELPFAVFGDACKMVPVPEHGRAPEVAPDTQHSSIKFKAYG